MNVSGISALTGKDFSLYFQNRFFAVVTVVGIVAYLGVYFLLPAGVDQSLAVALYSPTQVSSLENVESEGLNIDVVDSEDSLRAAVEEGEYSAGIALPEGLTGAASSGDGPKVKLYFPPDTPDATKSALRNMIREWSYALTGRSLNVQFSDRILGRDFVTGPIPARDRLIPLFAVLLIMTETLGLASLITEEIETGTLRALLVSPISTSEVFLAKGLTGVGLASIQAIFFMGIVGGLSRSPGVILVSLILGSAMLTGLAFLIASVSRDTLSVMAWGILSLIIMMIPAVVVLFPGGGSWWMKIIPSYYLLDSVHMAANFGAGWGVFWSHFLALAVATLVINAGGIWVLERRQL